MGAARRLGSSFPPGMQAQLRLLAVLLLQGLVPAAPEAAAAAPGLAVETLQSRRAVVAGAGPFEQAVLFRLTAPEAAAGSAQELCVALDVSPSMDGRKMEVALHALGALARGLRAGDRLHLVTFHAGARVEFANGTVAQQPRLLEALAALPQTVAAQRRVAAAGRARSGRQEHSELEAAFDSVEAVMGAASSGLGSAAWLPRVARRLFLVTDGLATATAEGEDAGGVRWEIFARAERLQQRGVPTSVFAVGGDHDQRLLRDLARAGHGPFVWLDGSARSMRRLSEEAFAKAFAPAAVGATLALTPGLGAERRLHVFGHRRRRSRGPREGERSAPPAVSVPVGTVVPGVAVEVVLTAQLPAITGSSPYLPWELSFLAPSGTQEILSGTVRVEVWRPEACEEAPDGYQEPFDRFPIIAGAEWEATSRWNCGGVDENISSHIQGPSRGTAGSVVGRRWCAARCVEVPECVAFSYGNPGDGRCWLKRGDAQHSSVLGKTCGGFESIWDYYTLLHRKPECPGAHASLSPLAPCEDLLVTGARAEDGAPCLPDRTAQESTGNGVYKCDRHGPGGRNVYKLTDGPVNWEIRWESGGSWATENLGKLAGFGGLPKWVLHGNGQFRYFMVSDSDTPLAGEWLTRNAENTDHACAHDGIRAVPARRPPDHFVETAGRCADAAGVEVSEQQRTFGVAFREACEAACLAEPACRAYEHGAARVCVLHASRKVAAGDGQLRVQCYRRARATQYGVLAPGRRCANAHLALAEALLTPEACAELVAAEPSCGRHFAVGKRRARSGCACVPLGAACAEVPDATSDVYEVVEAFGAQRAISILADMHKLLEQEETFHPDRESAYRDGYWIGPQQAGLAAAVTALAERARYVGEQDPTSARLGLTERMLELESRWHWQTSACAGAPHLCRRAAPPLSSAPSRMEVM